MAATTKTSAATAAVAKKRPAKKAAATAGDDTFNAEERAAMKEAAKERRAQKSGTTDGLADVLAKIAAMDDDDREIAEKVHALVLAAAPDLQVRTWYGMPAYAMNGKVVCFFQDAAKFKARYCTLGFQDPANLDEGSMWATSFAITGITRADEKRITDLVRRAVS
ncbi:MAG TPA: DUF1801 domain-containing protein [Candidatus Nanopelagicales bacterium]|nr:DUF1801 domain-containing protein [Candidatus Nanopelagicales bacterium]